MTQRRRPGHCFLLSVCCHSRSRKRLALACSFRTVGSGWTLSWLGHGLWQNGWGLGGHCHGWDMDALAERMGSGRALSWLGNGCFGRTDGVWANVVMVGTWMLWQNGRCLGGRYQISWLGHGCSGRTNGVWVDVVMVGTWMLWQNGWGLGGRYHGWDCYHGWDMDALAKRMGSGRVDVISMDALWQCVNTSIHTYIRTYIHTHTHYNIHICVCLCV